MEILETNLAPKNAENFHCKKCDFVCSKQSEWSRHVSTRKHKMETMEMNLAPKNAEKFHCKTCDFICSKQRDWIRHTSTRKHKMETLGLNLAPKAPKKRQSYECCGCNNVFKSMSGLWKHKKKCYMFQTVENTNYDSLTTTSNTIDSTTVTGMNNDVTHKLVELIMSKNQEFMTELVTKLTCSNKDVMEKMIEIMPNIGNNNHSHNTNSNNNFNIQMFLNDHCKNAMNLSDFIESLPITAETYDNTIENGLTKTITTMITNGLSQLDVLDRPIHCTDATRKTLYVKEANVWEKDTELMRILIGIKTLARKQRTMINKWQDANEGWEKEDNIQTKMTTLICHSMTDIENNEKETTKIIRAISKNVYLDNEAKQFYIQ